MDLINSLGNWFGLLINRITTIGESIVNVFSYILSIFQAIRYGITTLLSGIWSLIVEVFEGGVFVNIARAFDTLSDYIGGPAVVFLATILFIIIVRIFIAFVFKILRLNIDYNSLNSKTRTWNQHSALDSQKKSLFG